MSMRMQLENEDKDFEEEFDEELDEALIQYLHEIQQNEKDSVRIINIERAKLFFKMYQFTQDYFGEQAKVRYQQGGGLAPGCWDIIINGAELKLDKPSGVVKEVLSNADCFEVNAEPDGTVTLGISFYGMMDREVIK